jgi:hypothetical protein
VAADTLHYGGTRVFEVPSDWYQEMEKDVCPEPDCHNLKHPESRVCQPCHMKRMRKVRMANAAARNAKQRETETREQALITMSRYLNWLEERNDG